ncbi:MAG: hypothetical protein CME63_16050 [Halobacteriovoraceae bacterium]|nr:hypothetical protein [Halobacteriovoraceae bacterium]|tara:strand:- start:99285 stop:100241 length:957 start_codon:yes stop_codon:yes gene_type:complete
MSSRTLYQTLLPLLLTLTLNFSCVPQNEDCDASDTSCEVSEENGSEEQEGDGEVEEVPTEEEDEDEEGSDENPVEEEEEDEEEHEHAQEPTETIRESFFSPWNKGGSTIVIDAYQGNSIDWNQMASDNNMVGVIHRSSIGLRVDTKYESRKNIAKSRGYLWGAYHLGYRGDTIKQADLFLDLIDGEQDTLMILDLEDTANGRFMSIDEAVVFMEYVYNKTGRIPVVYANHSTTIKLNQRVAAHPLFQQAKLWYARFKSNVTDFPFGIWNNYFLWQFSSEINCNSTGSCLYNVPGTRYDMDVNVFYGSRGELESRWHNY